MGILPGCVSHTLELSLHSKVAFLTSFRLDDKPNVLFTQEVFRAHVILLLAVSVYFIDA